MSDLSKTSPKVITLTLPEGFVDEETAYLDDPEKLLTYLRGYKSYKVNGRDNLFNLDTYVKYIRTRFDSFNAFEQTLPLPPAITRYLKDNWEDIEPYKFAEAMAIKNADARAIVFSAMDMNELYENSGLEFSVLVSSKIKKKGHRYKAIPLDKVKDYEGQQIWYLDKEPIVRIDYEIDETYDILRYTRSHFLGENNNSFGFSFGRNRGRDLYDYIVRCTCPTTGHVHYIRIDGEDVADSEGNLKKGVTGISAICTTFITYMKEVKAVYRQGDTFFTIGSKKKENMLSSPRVLTEKEYREVLISES